MAPTFSVGHTLNNVKCIIHCSGAAAIEAPSGAVVDDSIHDG